MTTVFNHRDFRVFDITDFADRMHAIRERIAPRLELIGAALAPAISALVDQPVYCHVARHARRTVHPPDDTWVAFGPDRRGYKKDVHFKVAVSRHCVRLLFEVGPEYYAKSEWVRNWTRERRTVVPVLRSGTQLAWFRSEHDEEPAGLVGKLDPDAVGDLGQALVGRRDGQFVMGRRLDASRVTAMEMAAFRKVAASTFRPLAPLFGLHDQRRVA